MTFNQIILTVFLVAIFTLIFGSVYLLPSLFAKMRSHKYGLKLNFKQAKTLVKNNCLKADFLVGVKEIWEIHPIQINKLVDHYHAGGDLINLKVGVSEMIQREMEPDINMLTALNLANRDLKIEVEKAERNNWMFEL